MIKQCTGEINIPIYPCINPTAVCNYMLILTIDNEPINKPALIHCGNSADAIEVELSNKMLPKYIGRVPFVRFAPKPLGLNITLWNFPIPMDSQGVFGGIMTNLNLGPCTSIEIIPSIMN